MASIVKSMCIFLVIAVAVIAIARKSEAAVSCGMVVSSIKPCLAYVIDEGPLGSCCNGVRSLNSAAKTTPDRQSVCNCLRSFSGKYSGINPGKTAGLPGLCGVSIPYKISPSTDCSKVV